MECEFRPLATYFGPNSLQVARLLLQLQGELNLETRYLSLDKLKVSAEAAELEVRVMDAAKRDPNLSAAIQRAWSVDWYRNSNRLWAYVQKHPRFAAFRRLAILAEVAQPLLPGSEFDLLYGPMADFIDPLSLGLPVS
jgi:hypothetical protein